MITNRKFESGVCLTISLEKEEEHYITWEQRVSSGGCICDIGYFVIGARYDCYDSDDISGIKGKTKRYNCRYGMIGKMQKYRKEWLERNIK